MTHYTERNKDKNLRLLFRNHATLKTMELHILSTEKKKALNPDFYILLPPPKKKNFQKWKRYRDHLLKQTIIVGIYCQLLYFTGNIQSSSDWRQITSEENLDLYKRMKCTRNEINRRKIKLFLSYFSFKRQLSKTKNSSNALWVYMIHRSKSCGNNNKAWETKQKSTTS